VPLLRIAIGLLIMSISLATAADQILVDVDEEFGRLELRDADLPSIPALPGQGLAVVTGHDVEWPGFTLFAPEGGWDLQGWQSLTASIRNAGAHRLSVGLRVDAPGADSDESKRVQVVIDVAPGETKKLTVALHQTPWAFDGDTQIVGMRAAPGQAAIDLSQVEKLIIFVVRPDVSHRFVVEDLILQRHAKRVSTDGFLPFIDRFGQFIHADWETKIGDDSDLTRMVQAEAADLAAHPGPADRSRFGGWAAGPRFEATGYFRPYKHEGQWWLVDPEGYLFWSHGIDCVNTNAATGTTDRESYFAGLPDESDAGPGQFYGQSTWAPHGYYHDRTPFRTFNHRQANLWRKHGDNWRDAFARITHQRLRSWGMNTIANWSDAGIYSQQKTPYVAAVWLGARPLQGSQGYWGKFHDVYDPGFRGAVHEALAARQTEAVDPWCIGFFVDNELAWGDELNLALASLASPGEQPAKRVFVEVLRAKYGLIQTLNQAWGTGHASWEDLLSHQDPPPDLARARVDLVAFTDSIAHTYFRTIKQELTALSPEQLYLGPRFAWQNKIVVRASLDYCDVVSFNKYQYSVADLRLPDEADHPVIIGEFHFGAVDRGMFHPGLRAARDQAHRGELYSAYVRSALQHRLIVGTHWFQYGDQSTTGRGDGENYNIGFIDIADVPYPAMVGAAREMGAQMYTLRSSTELD
jgi:hypothetical protein